ncbi:MULTISPECIES: glycosyltransferase family 39 protein [unclassified Amycolatopsis]|uniref:ArnT family glycosyltransferase n=1 Tax=unclassified Amycolatopsis TaxID=2618356 RepID=UPI0028759F7E|nr:MULTISPECIES: glycosyltransferase family 39 protein [unclassified Amycolatopsis]MDS0135368.1 glycosyltransferase family 39 protein [Amycolatopsis sp. 505]MDS0140941.1 glycosyltransferase family 39 protein [Amycolatopsis sp. CM201R]
MITAAPPRTRPWALPLVCLGAAVLYAWKIGDGQFGNTYYSAAAKSMTENFTNFLFGSFDPYGVVTVDKPPLALWPQALSVLIFGYHGWALLLPQVLEGVAAVFLLHRTVRLWAGENVALLAAAILALTPVTVIINRDNNPDTLLVLFLVAAAYALTRALRDGRKWLWWCAFFVGCGFLTKMLQAWIIVPALVAAYLAGTSGPLHRRLLDVLGAGLVLVVSSFWWIALYDWWPGAKPYMGGSEDGSAWDLVFGYNGFGRLSGNGEGGGMMIMRNGQQTMSSFGGDPGPGRMFNDVVGGQISWLLPLCLLVLVVLGRRWRDAGWLLWGGWLLVTTVVFSFAGGIWHPYYTTALAPAVAAVSAAGLALLWRRHRRTLLPLAVALTAAWAFVLTSRDTSFHGWTRWAVLGTGVAAIAGLYFGRSRVTLLTALVPLLLTPAVWSYAAAQSTSAGTLPAAGPATGPAAPPPPPSPGGPRLMLVGGDGATKLSDEQRRILDYARRNGTEITLAVNAEAGAVAPFLIDSDATVIGMGGFGGRDNAPSVAHLERWLAEGKLRFVLSGAGSPPGPSRSPVQGERQRWIERHCTVVDPAEYGGRPTRVIGGADTLYRC